MVLNFQYIARYAVDFVYVDIHFLNIFYSFRNVYVRAILALRYISVHALFIDLKDGHISP